MGILNKIKILLAKKQEEPTQPQQEINNYLQSERSKYLIDNAMRYEKTHFLYGSDSNE